VRSPSGVPSRGWRRVVPCRHGSACAPTSGLCSTEESVAIEKRCHSPSLDAPLGFWIAHVPMPAARKALDGRIRPFTWRLQLRSGVPHLPRGMGKAKSRLRLAPSGPMWGPTRRSVVRRSGPLTARRLLRFRSARWAPEGVDRDRSHGSGASRRTLRGPHRAEPREVPAWRR
jgi:hypothetical protein